VANYTLTANKSGELTFVICLAELVVKSTLQVGGGGSTASIDIVMLEEHSVDFTAYYR
jgi:hypothetical protein